MSRVFASFSAFFWLRARGAGRGRAQERSRAASTRPSSPGCSSWRFKRQGSSPLPAAAGGAERVLVYFNATLRLREGYDFKDWEA